MRCRGDDAPRYMQYANNLLDSEHWKYKIWPYNCYVRQLLDD